MRNDILWDDGKQIHACFGERAAPFDSRTFLVWTKCGKDVPANSGFTNKSESVTCTECVPVLALHVLRTGEPKCPKCGQGLESEGGSVSRAGSWGWGPMYWRCEDDGEEWGHA